jgi:Lrp/AsnC family leucine-responsive transcriptional regulator
MADFDDIDLALIELLQKDARTPQAQLAAQVGLAASSVNERIRKLGERGLIEGYHARISAEAMGYDLLLPPFAWSRPETEKAFLKSAQPVRHHGGAPRHRHLELHAEGAGEEHAHAGRPAAKVIKAVPGIERT